MTGMLWGCATVNGTPPLGSAPLFQADATDTVILQAVQREQDALLSTCAQHQSCDQVHFTRAMIALFQDGETAATSFQQAIAVAPKGPFADSSAGWIRFLANRPALSAPTDEPNGELHGAVAVMKGLVRTWLEQQRASNPSVPLRAVETAKSQDLAVPTLRRQIRTRDKRIAELTEQLSTLKQIDLEAHRPNKLSLPKTLSK
jgi:predicted membrane metal-binding protein